MIAKQDEFKMERARVMKSLDIVIIRAFAKKYSIKLPYDNEEVLRLASLTPEWD